MDEGEIRRGVRDGIHSVESSGFAFLLILFECALIGAIIYVASDNWFRPEGAEDAPSIASWLGWGSGLVSFFLFFVPFIRGILIFAFSILWAWLAYYATWAMMNDVSEADLSMIATSPIPYVVGIFVALMSYGLHLMFTE